MVAKNSISISEVLRVVANETDRIKASLNNLDHAVAERKCVSVLFIALATAARKTKADKYLTLIKAETPLEDFIKKYEETLHTKRNRTLD